MDFCLKLPLSLSLLRLLLLMLLLLLLVRLPRSSLRITVRLSNFLLSLYIIAGHFNFKGDVSLLLIFKTLWVRLGLLQLDELLLLLLLLMFAFTILHK